MPVEIVTVVNSSGKIISNGKHLINVFKEARATYQEKKAAIKAELAIRRAETFDVRTPTRNDDENEDGRWRRRISHDDAMSYVSYATSRKSHRSKQSDGSRRRSVSQARTALTERNLQTLTEVSSTAPSRPPIAYRPPYAETAPRDMTISRPTLVHARTMPVDFEQNALVPRSASDPTLRDKGKDIDMHLAYGDLPPDLAERIDLDPAHRNPPHKIEHDEREARDLVGKIEDLLTEAQCVHHTAQHIIQHLQGNPEAAAAVALTLAELSAILGKMSPSFLAVLKGGSPAIFALLASPQFLIAAGVTVGVTIVMFGGWKIIKRIQEAKSIEAARPMAFASQPPHPIGSDRPPYPETEVSAGFDEALVIEEELSAIETWRRGIVPFGEDEHADLELISPEADRAIRSQYGGDDAQTVHSARTSKTHRTSKTTKSHKSQKSRKDSVVDSQVVPDRKSSKGSKEVDEASEAGSRHSHRTHRSHRSDRTDHTSKTKATERGRPKAIEDGRKDRASTFEGVVRPKKDNILKNLFKKMKEREEKERVVSVVA
ncbi:hypothetical protein GGS23DRAFT_586295 [Durotheca rogersii]|uniref:uncharacterized protein n=1 Tax=Durotheca rogersii TaxID=419775 RepID=UPI00221F93D2|nr:uncharacterized protein GGS23DRAFT_586295 [Durotheca rogersii]KAI5859248.1 hypothetical protein GGS23DRAFT_586295 [Durotheca rogersii]